MNPIRLDAFHDELEKIAAAQGIEKTAIDPATLGAIGVGKYFLSNAMQLYGHKIPVIRRLGQEIVGAGLRAGMKGKPPVSPVSQGIFGTLIDPHMAKMYRASHAAGKSLSGADASAVKLKKIVGTHQVKALMGADAAKFIQGVPLKADTRLRKAIDYGHTPVRQVGRDIKELLRKKPPGAFSKETPWNSFGIRDL